MIGSKFKVRKNRDGSTSWCLRVTVDGKRISKTVRCHTTREADRALAKFVAEAEKMQRDKSDITWTALCEEYLNQHARIAHKKSTFETEKRKFEKWIIPAFDVRVSEITRRDIQTWVNSLDSSPKTVRNLYGMVSQVLSYAVRMEYIDASPANNVALPRYQRAEAESLTGEEVIKLLECIEKEPSKYKAAVYLGIFGGLRKSEVLGVKWSDLDLETGLLRITRSRHQQAGETYTDTTKTAAGTRRETLPEFACDFLREFFHMQEQHAELLGWNIEEAFIVAHEDGRPVSPSAYSDWIIRLRARDPDCPRFSSHMLRHTNASLLRATGSTLEEIQKRLGHADKTTTQKIYVHLFEDPDTADKKAASRIDEFLKKNI